MISTDKITTILFSILFFNLLTACQPLEVKKELIRPIKAIKIGSTELIIGKSFPGSAKATQEVDLSFRVVGTLNKMPVKIGQKVRVGDVLAELDKRDYEVEVANAKAGLANAKAIHKNAELEYRRMIRIQQTNASIVSQSTVDTSQANFEQAKASVDSAIASLSSATDRLSYTSLKAPFDGVIVQRFVDNFEDITANTPVFRLVDISKIEMDINIPENLISNLPYVKNSRVIFDAFPDKIIPAKIKEVSNEASASTRTYQVRLIMNPPPGINILPGMSGNAMGEVIKSNAESIQVIIPINAIFSSNDSASSYVWFYKEESQTVTKQEVEKGGLTEQGIVITKGLKTGDWIAIAGVHFLREGQKVRLLDKKGTVK